VDIIEALADLTLKLFNVFILVSLFKQVYLKHTVENYNKANQCFSEPRSTYQLQ